jgi:hypothetical protein
MTSGRFLVQESEDMALRAAEERARNTRLNHLFQVLAEHRSLLPDMAVLLFGSISTCRARVHLRLTSEFIPFERQERVGYAG